MALLNCNECKKEVSTQAKRCPHCGAKPPKEPISLGKFIGIMSFLSFMVLLIYFVNQMPERELTPQEKVERSIRHAAYSCGYAIKGYLNDPGSAEFDYDHIDAVPEMKGNDAAWVVSVPVRAKNAFNATILNVFQCRVQSDGNDHWNTLSVRRIS